jgi:hypothetical protein
MCVAKRHIDEGGSRRGGGQTPRRRSFDEEEINSSGQMCVAKRHIDEAGADEEPWSRQKGYDDGSPLLFCFHLKILLKDKPF